MTRFLFDIEVYQNLFYLAIKDVDTLVLKEYEVSDFKDDRSELFKFLENLEKSKNKNYAISFNGVHYDMCVLGYIYDNRYLLSTYPVNLFTQNCKRTSDEIINENEHYRKYKYSFRNKNLIQIDLYLYWARLLRISKKISLKGLGIQMGYPTVQELPYHPSTILSQKQIEEVKHYCNTHDLGILQMLYENKYEEIKLRQNVVINYGINAWSMDAPKIASETLLKAYCDITGKNPNSVSKMRFERPTIKFKDLLSDIPINFVTSAFQNVYEEWLNSIDTFSKEFIVFTSNGIGIEISTGIGGLHQNVRPSVFKKKHGKLIVDIDIESMYPNLILNYEAFRFKEVEAYYEQIKTFRITETKPNIRKYKDTPEEEKWKMKDTFYKLILNGVSGHLDNEFSWLRNSEGIMKVRCGGQLILLELVEQFIINHFTVLQQNTDGVTVEIEESELNLLYSLVQRSEEKHKIKFEYANYQLMVFEHVNSYIAITESGKVKEKGMFVRKPELGNSTDFLIIPNMLYDYFVSGILPEKSIYNYNDIYLFCASQKVDKTYTVEWNGKLP